MWFDPGHGYHQDHTTGVAKGNEPESIYAVMSGKRFNGHCCFDYGNSENTTAQPVHSGDYACGAMAAPTLQPSAVEGGRIRAQCTT